MPDFPSASNRRIRQPITADDLAVFEPWDRPSLPRRRPRRLSISRAISHARKAGADVVIAPDGSVTLRFGERDDQPAPTGDDDWKGLQ